MYPMFLIHNVDFLLRIQQAVEETWKEKPRHEEPND